MSTLRFILVMAWRESRATRRRLLLLLGAVGVGVAALVATNAFTDNLRDSADAQARALVGADVVARGRDPFTPRAIALFDSLACGGRDGCGNLARVTSFAAMAYVPRTTGTRLVQVSAVDPGYPYYGEITTDPRAAWAGLHQGRHIVVDPSLLTALDAQVGDSLALGNTRFLITGAATGIPGNVGIRAAFGPRVFIPARYLDETGLLTFGALAQYEAYIKVPADADVRAEALRIRRTLAEERVTARSVADDQQDLGNALEQMGRYLGLVALVALLLGGLGVASAVHVFIRRKIETVGVLRCLGASSAQLVGVYLVQATVMGLAGTLLGAAAGVGLQKLLPRLFIGLLPVDVSFAVSWAAIFTGIGTGVWVTAVFALLPLLSLRLISPLAVLRRAWTAGGPAQRRRDPLRWPVYILLVLSVITLSALQVGHLASALGFSAGILVVLAVLALAALGLIRGLRRWFPHGLPYLWRQGMANLYRPANQTVMVVLALGFGAFLLCTLYLVQANLLQRFQLDASGGRPNLVFWDIQSDQREGIERLVRDAGITPTSPVPIVPMRVASVKGRPVDEILKDTLLVGDDGERLGRWAFRREYRSTYRDTMVTSEKSLVGSFWTPDRPDTGIAPISVEAGLAGELDVGVGDTIVWDVQGVRIPTRIVDLREVNWARFEPNFFVVFPKGVLDRAPQTWVTLARVDDAAERGRLQRAVAEGYPNVTTLDLTQLLASVERIVDRVVLVIRFMALFSLGAGAVVLAGAIATSRLQRIREGVLLRTLGATRGQVFRIVLAEYFSLGLLATMLALVLSSAAGWLIMHRVFDLTFRFPVAPLTALAAGVLGLTVLVGLWNSTEVFRKTPMELLRSEE